MGKIIAGINMTLDGVCDHTKVDPDAQVHKHYEELLRQTDAILYGRITYQLMEFWKSLLESPSGNQSLDDFAVAIDGIPKIVFSRTLHDVDWKSAALAKRNLEEETRTLAEQPGKRILVGSRSLIIDLLRLNLIDEFQLMIHPVIAGEGMKLFENIRDRKLLKLTQVKVFDSGAVLHYYEPVKEPGDK
ncbi:dihydrofolate reductase family protein [Dyadobacter jiangsuensis]|uniref:Dihydrofolate reductase n=1 Tax=Dyadobacter jiangsuensis TaxID=1591085 RepID=A0A2P8FL68_9BACT|nr:dihydrofolate reductase family protein [Dyadobacter jiangsuensis]PSL22468.1 dihydrofolate reductase [Dyadobacter jiangsuensis]